MTCTAIKLSERQLNHSKSDKKVTRRASTFGMSNDLDHMTEYYATTGPRHTRSSMQSGQVPFTDVKLNSLEPSESSKQIVAEKPLHRRLITKKPSFGSAKKSLFT